MNAWAEALERILSLDVLGVIALSAAYGLFVGAIPGLTATMAVALLVPITYYMDEVAALASIVTLEACAIFAGDIPTALVRMPGTPSSAAYADDAFALTRAGRGAEALGISLVFSVAGGLFGALVLIFAAPQLAAVAGRFSFQEDFWLCVLGLSCAAVVSRGSPLKGALSLLIGLLLSTVGLSPVHTEARFTFGIDDLLDGINFIPAMIGLFGVSEVLRNAMAPQPGGNPSLAAAAAERTAGVAARLGAALKEVFRSGVFLLARRWIHTLRSSATGCVVGMLPGAGADIGAWISYAFSKRFSRRPKTYGTGSREGLADATAANNAALAGAWIPALVFGIPGDSVTAIVIGVLMMKNLSPGPEIFSKQPVLVDSIYLTFIAANLLLLPLGFLAIRLGRRIVGVPNRFLLPAILVFSIVGSYAFSGSYTDVLVMLAMGLLGFVLERKGVPLGPIVLGLILGNRLEKTFIQSLAVSSSPLDFFSRPYAALLGALSILVWVLPPALRVLRRMRAATD